MKLPEAVNFDGSPTNYQEFMTSMGFYFWARHEVFRGNNSGILYIGVHLIGSATIWFDNLSNKTLTL
ncbi:hypothetical protein AYI68_g8292 [Smittium mucronatum]|uniref:Uncharacterized protein n=1 Tax=Smittium mucronatum TaxID=133383 RepID=A0A1R0GLB0_9FUNG|nr:hypothetical protein AYI68_g8292 [Smittium mucronatum]